MGPSYHAPSKLSLSSLPSNSRTSTLPDDSTAPTPPPRTAAVSVPFHWEEAPGKPRHCRTGSDPNHRRGGAIARTLDLPPRLMTKTNSSSTASPTTVLDGPYDVGRAVSFTSSCRVPKEANWNANFGSSRWSEVKEKKKNNVEEEDLHEGSFDFSSWTADGTSKVKITRIRRRGSFLSLNQTKSQLWAGIYESLKQVVPWKRRQNKRAPKIDSV